MHDWESSTRPDGWNLSDSGKISMKLLNLTTGMKKECYDRMQFFVTNSISHTFVHKTEAYIELFRYHWENRKDYNSAYTFIKNAIHQIVVTAEVHLKNNILSHIFQKKKKKLMIKYIFVSYS